MHRLTLTISGQAVALSRDDAAFLIESLSAAIAHPGHRFERSRQTPGGVLNIAAGATAHSSALPGIQAFTRGADAAQTDC